MFCCITAVEISIVQYIFLARTSHCDCEYLLHSLLFNSALLLYSIPVRWLQDLHMYLGYLNSISFSFFFSVHVQCNLHQFIFPVVLWDGLQSRFISCADLIINRYASHCLFFAASISACGICHWTLCQQRYLQR